MKRALLKSAVCALMLCSTTAMAGVGIYVSVEKDPGIHLSAGDKIRIDQYGDKDPTRNWGTPRIRGYWQTPDDKFTPHYVETRSENYFYLNFFAVSISSLDKPVCLLNFQGTVQYSGLRPKMPGANFRINTTDFGMSKNIMCTARLKEDPRITGDTYYLTVKVGYYNPHDVPAEPVTHRYQDELIRGFPSRYINDTDFLYYGTCSDKYERRFEVGYDGDGHYAKEVDTGLYYVLPIGKDRSYEGTRLWAAETYAVRPTCRAEGGTIERQR